MQPRTIDAVRAHIGAMPFAVHLGVAVVEAGAGTATVTMPRSPHVAWNATGFAGAFVGLVADLAAGAAALSILPADRSPMTMAVDCTLTGPTDGTTLRAVATLASHNGNALAFTAVVHVDGPHGSNTCGAALVSLRATGSTTADR